MDIEKKLANYFRDNKEVAIGFSGGVDSSYLLYMANRYGKRVKGYFAKGIFQPEFELRDAERLAREIGADIEVIDIEPLGNMDIVKNGEDRCYHCKNVVFGKICARAKEDGFGLVIDGTNLSDMGEDRPGLKALEILGVESPLRDLGFTKEMVRECSKKAGLFTWDKPSYACLATRLEPNRDITLGRLKKVERGEDFLAHLGFRDFRIREFGSNCRLEISSSDFERLMKNREAVLKEIGKLFDKVTLDLKFRDE